MRCENKMKKKVIMIEKPILSTWSSESHFMSLILKQKEAMSWVVNNYMNLIGHFFEDTQMITLGFFPRHDPTNPESPINAWNTCPFVETKCVSYEFISDNYESIISYLVEAINEEWCVYLDLRQEFLDRKMPIGTHKTFIYGYDDIEKVMMVADHYANGKYDTEKIGYENIKLSFEKAYERNVQIESNKRFSDKKQSIFELRKIILIKLRECDYTFNVEWFKIQLNDYINSRYTLECVAPVHKINNTKLFYGIECYKFVIDYMYVLLEERINRIDWRCITLLCDHKKMLKIRIEYFYVNKICDITEQEIKGYEYLVKQSQVVLNCFLKYCIKQDKAILIRIIEKIRKMKEIEVVLLEGLINKI